MAKTRKQQEADYGRRLTARFHSDRVVFIPPSAAYSFFCAVQDGLFADQRTVLVFKAPQRNEAPLNLDFDL